jgi:hypothetical protein
MTTSATIELDLTKSCNVSPYQPSAEDVATYEERGYWISPKLLSDEHIAHLRGALDRMYAGHIDGDGWYYQDIKPMPDDPTALRRIVNSWWVNDAVRDVVLDPNLGRMSAALMKTSGARLWADQSLSKPGAGPDAKTAAGNVGWHQDYGYWQTSSTTNMITAWIALQDTDLNNGGMRTLVGSHKWGLVENSARFFEKDLNGLRKEFEAKVSTPWIDEPCVLKAGQASFHHSLCFHGSETNRTSEPRMSVVGHYMPDGTTFRPAGRFQTFMALLGPRPTRETGYGGKCFPRVYPLDPQFAREIGLKL